MGAEAKTSEETMLGGGQTRLKRGKPYPGGWKKEEKVKDRQLGKRVGVLSEKKKESGGR